MSVLLSEHMPLLASGPNGIQKLRGLILELAVRGKLVLQDLNDELAGESLMRIARERTRLESEGVCKKPKPLPPVGEDEQPFHIPNSWQWVRLATVASFENGDRSKNYPSRDEFVRSGIPFINAGHLRDRRVDFSNMNFIPVKRFDALRAGKTRRGDILFCLRGSLGKFGVVSFAEPAAIASSLVIIRTVQEDLLKYLELYLSSPMILAQISRFDNGTAQPNLSAADLSKFVFPLPSFAEQQRIVAKVDELMTLCDRLEAEEAESEVAHARIVDTLLGTLTQSTDEVDSGANWRRLAYHFDTVFTTESSLDVLKQAILQLGVTGKLVPQDSGDEPIGKLLKRLPEQPIPPRYATRSIATIAGTCALSVNLPELPAPKGWMWVPLIAVARLESGHTPSRNRSDWWDGDVPWIGIADARIHNDGLILETLQTTNPAGLENSAARLLPAGTVCFSRTASVGYVVTMGKPMATSQDFVNWVPTEAISSAYLALVFRAERPAIKRFSKGAVHQTIYFPEWLAMHVLLPPLAEQHRIVAKVNELMSVCDRLKTDLADSRHRQARLASTLIESTLKAA